MDTHHKDMATLFEQLGLDSDPESIDAFIASHRPLADDQKVTEANFWSESQKAFLREEIMADADWEPIIDELNVRLHENIR